VSGSKVTVDATSVVTVFDGVATGAVPPPLSIRYELCAVLVIGVPGGAAAARLAASHVVTHAHTPARATQ
jgi:hypothetical protein